MTNADATTMQATINTARLRTNDGTLVILLNGFSSRAVKHGQSVKYKDPEGLMRAVVERPGASHGQRVLAEHDNVKGWTVWGEGAIPPGVLA